MHQFQEVNAVFNVCSACMDHTIAARHTQLDMCAINFELAAIERTVVH